MTQRFSSPRHSREDRDSLRKQLLIVFRSRVPDQEPPLYNISGIIWTFFVVFLLPKVQTCFWEHLFTIFNQLLETRIDISALCAAEPFIFRQFLKSAWNHSFTKEIKWINYLWRWRNHRNGLDWFTFKSSMFFSLRQPTWYSFSH